MLSTTAAKFQVDATPESGYGELEFSVSTEMMKDHSTGMPVDPQHRIAVLRDSNNAPMIFSIGSDSGFYLILRDPSNAAGWKQIDLRPGIHKSFSYMGENATAQAMAVSQDANGTIRIAVALKPVNAPGKNNILFLTKDLSNDPSKTNWDDLSTVWVERPDNLGGVQITQIKLGTNNDHQGTPTVLAIVEVNGEEKHYFVNSNFSNTSWIWQAYPIPHNADKILDVAVGTFGVRGTWALYTVGAEKVLTFTSLRTAQMPQPIDIIYKNMPPNLQAIGTLPSKDGKNTDVYAAGDGLYVYRTVTPPHGSPTYVTITDRSAVPGASELILSQAGNTVSIWAMDENEQLVFVQGRNDNEQAWTTPVPLLSNVSQIAPLCDAQNQVNDVFIVTNDSKLEYMWRDESSTLWNTQEIGIHSTGTMLTYQAYVTHIKVKSSNTSQQTVNNPLKISASSYGYVTINGRSHIISPSHEINVVPDEMGVVTITQKIEDIAAPVVHVKADFLTTGFDVHQSAPLNQGLQSMTADDLANATFQYGDKQGQKVLQGKYADSSHIQASTQVLSKITDLALISFDDSTHAHLANQGVKLNPSGKAENKIDLNKLPNGYAWGFTWDDSTLNFSDGPHAIESIGKILEANPLTWFIGDVLEHFGKKLESKPKSFFMHLTAEGVLELVIDFGESVIQTAIDVVEQVVKALSWVLKELFGIDLMKILEWLGFLFEWDDILVTHEVLVNAANNLIEFGKSEVTLFKDYINTFCDYLLSELKKIQPYSSEIGTTSAQKISDTGQSAARSGDNGNGFEKVLAFFTDSPVGNWGMAQLLQGNILEGSNQRSTDSPWVVQLTNAVARFAGDTILEEFNDFETTISQIATDLKRLYDDEDLSFNKILAQLGGDILEGMIEAIRIFLTKLLDLLVDILSALKTGVNETIDIPLLSPLYKIITKGKELSALDAMMLIMAIPTTVGMKLVLGKAPFEKGYVVPFNMPPVTDLPLPSTPGIVSLAASRSVMPASVRSEAIPISRVASFAAVATASAESGNQESEPEIGEDLRNWTYTTAVLLFIGSFGTTIVDIIAYKATAKLKGEDGEPLIGKENALTEAKVKYGVFHLAFRLPTIIASFPYTANKASYMVQMFVGVLNLTTIVKDGLFLAAKSDKNLDWSKANIITDAIYTLLELVLEIPILVLELNQAEKEDNDQAKRDVEMKFAQHGIATVSEIGKAVEELDVVKDPIAEGILVGAVILLNLGANLLNIARMSLNAAENKPHHNV